MVDVMPGQVREWVTGLKTAGMSPASIAANKVILSAIFTTALNDQVTFLHPCKGVKTPPVPVKPRTIITPEQFGELYSTLPDAGYRLLAETAIETGVRWGELAELRVRDLEFPSRMLTVSRTVVEVNPLDAVSVACQARKTATVSIRSV